MGLASFRRRWAVPLAVATTVLIVNAVGFWIWYSRLTHDPVYLIKHGSSFERLQAAADLGVLKEDTDVDRVMAVLADAIDDGDIALRSTCEEALGALTAQVRERPGGGATFQKGQTEREVAFAIQKLTQCLSDPEPAIRTSAAFALGSLASKSPVDLPPKLVQALEDESTVVRQAAMKALNKAKLTQSVVPALIATLARSDPELRFHATEILGRIGPAAEPAVPALLAMLSEPFDSKKQKDSGQMAAFWDPACGAAIALGKIGGGGDTIAGLTAMLSSDDPERAICAATGLASLGPAAASAIPALITAYDRVLRSEDHVLGQSAFAMALGEIGPRLRGGGRNRCDPDAGGSTPKDTWVRVSVIEALGKFGSEATAVKTRLREFEQSPVRELKDAARKSLTLIETSPGAVESNAKPSR